MPKRRSWSPPSTLAGLALAPSWGNSAVDLLYLPAVLGAAIFAGLGPALFAALASALAYNFFFTAPHLTFRIDNPNDVVTVAVLFAVAVVTSQLAASVRRQARIAAGPCRAERDHCRPRAAAARLHDGAGGPRGRHRARSRAVFECNAVLVGGGPEPQLLSARAALRPPDAGRSRRRRAGARQRRARRPGRRPGGPDRMAVPSRALRRRRHRGDGAGARRRRPAGPRGPAAAARQSARPGGARAGARPARRARRASSPASGSAIRCARSCSRPSARISRPGSRRSAMPPARCGAAARATRTLGRRHRRRDREDRALSHQPAGAGPGFRPAADRGRRRHHRPVQARGVPGRRRGPSDPEGISPCSPSSRSIAAGC